MYVYIYIHSIYHIPWKSKDYFLNCFSIETTVSVRVYDQQFQGTIFLMVFEFQGVYIYIHIYSWEPKGTPPMPPPLKK